MRSVGTDNEFRRPPEEFPAPAAQMTPPPEEFGSGGQGAPSPGNRRLYRWLAAAAAAGLLSAIAFFGDLQQTDQAPAPTPTSVVAAAVTAAPAREQTPFPTLDHTPSPSPVPTRIPTPTPVPTATPKPTPEPKTVPAAKLTFYRTSEVYHGMVILEAQDKMTAVTARIWDRGLGEAMWEYPFTAEDIARGWYTFPEYDLGASEFAKKHWDQLMAGYEPDPILEVICTARTDDGEQTFTEQAEAVDELWINGRYDLKDPDEDFLHYFMEETTYPDCFVVRIDPSPYGELNMTYGEDVELQPGDVAVILKVEGKTLSGDGWHLERTEIVYEEGTLYAYALVIPRPHSLPEHGSVEISITRKLIHYPTYTTTNIHTIEY